jgi:hypothetical protein
MIYVFESNCRSTGNFLTESINAALATNDIVVYVDSVLGFHKHGINEYAHENLIIIKSNNLRTVYKDLNTIINTSDVNISVYFDHFEALHPNEIVDGNDHLSIYMASAKYKRNILRLLSKPNINTYITAVVSDDVTYRKSFFNPFLYNGKYMVIDSFDKSLNALIQVPIIHRSENYMDNIQSIRCIIDSFFGIKIYHITTAFDSRYIITTKTIRAIKDMRSNSLSRVFMSIYRFIK